MELAELKAKLAGLKGDAERAIQQRIVSFKPGQIGVAGSGYAVDTKLSCLLGKIYIFKDDKMDTKFTLDTLSIVICPISVILLDLLSEHLTLSGVVV